jgi:hypothetical protein
MAADPEPRPPEPARASLELEPLAPLGPEPPLPPPPPAYVPPRPGFFALAFGGYGFALRCWRPLLAVLVVQLLLGLTVAVPFHAALSSRLDGHPHAAALAGTPSAEDTALGWEAGMDAGLWRDVKRELAGVFDALSVSLFWVLLLAWLFGAVAAGGFLTLAVEPGSHGAGRFFAEGGRCFFRMLRVGLVFAVAFLLVGRIVHEGWAAAVADAEAEAASSATGWWGQRVREGVLVALFLVLRVAADLARADLVVGRRRSALLAFAKRLGSVVRHPVRTLALAAFMGAPAFALLYALSHLLGALPTGGWDGVLAVFFVLEAAALLRWASRAALLSAFARDVHAAVQA